MMKTETVFKRESLIVNKIDSKLYLTILYR